MYWALEISSLNFQGILGSIERPSSKMVVVGCASGEKASLMFCSSDAVNVYGVNSVTGLC